MPTVTNLIGLGLSAAAGGLAAYLIIRRSKKVPTPKEVKFTYFDIKAHVGEKVRLALALSGTDFKDNRVAFADWTALKPTMKYGTLPVIDVDGKLYHQSAAILRWAGRLGDGSLYPVDDIETFMTIEEMLGLAADMASAWMPCLFTSMGRHEKYGHPKEWKDKDETVKRLRETFVAEQLPAFMAHLTTQLEKTGAFLAGDKPTIADCQLLPQVKYYCSGIADHVPKTCLDQFPVVLAWIDRMHRLPALKKWYHL